MLTINRVKCCQTVAGTISIGSIHCIFNQPHRCSICKVQSFYNEIITGHVNSLGAMWCHFYIHIYIFIYPHGVRSGSGELIRNLVKVSLGWRRMVPLIYISTWFMWTPV